MPQKTDDFVHLHVHTEFSMLDGHALISEMLDEVSYLGQRGIAINDHGNMHGAYELWKQARARDLTPVIGIEAYMTPGGHHHSHKEPVFFGQSQGSDREEGSDDVSSKGTYTHMTMLAETTEGMHNLFRMSSLSYIEGMYKKPRMSIDMLAENSKGVIATTGCPSGDIQTRLRLGQYNQAREFAGRMQDILGKENYFLELMDHGMKSELERGVRGDLLKLANELNIPLLATNDLHYTKRADAIKHEAMLAMQTGSNLNEPTYEQGGKRFAFEGDSYYVKSGAEMARIFGDFPTALSNTTLIAERAAGVMFEETDLRPAIGIPAGYTPESYIREQVTLGLIKRYGESGITQEHLDRVEHELSVIIPKNYIMYFLVVSDFVRWGKANGVTTGPARGSAGGSLVAYVLEITELDPIRHKLLFERFLNPERDSPPDIDMDFDDRNRERVIEYVRNKYGDEYVGYVATFGKIKAKSAIRDAAKILERPISLSNALSKAYPPGIMGKDMPLADVYEPNSKRYHEAEEFRQLVVSENAEKVVEIARGVENRIRQTGVHAAGIIISSKPLIDAVPLMTRANNDTMITQFDYPTCETLGLLKVDFLGLSNLTILRDAMDNIKESRGEDIDLYGIFEGRMDDPATYKLLQEGNALGVFQLDSGAIRDLLRRIAPTTFDDISAAIALYRPGPMGVNAHLDYADRKNGRQKVRPIHPELEKALEPVLGETHGLVVYQEQVMQAAQHLAGYTLAEADNLRRAMGKKKKEVLDKEFVPFSNGMKKNGFGDEAIKALWDVLVPFADYAFNKSHSVGYGLISYATAYLKANYPSEYMAALLTTSSDDPDKMAVYLQECKRMGLKVLPPSVNRSRVTYAAPAVDEVVVGLSNIRNVGHHAAEMIIESRPEGGYKSIQDLMSTAPKEVLNKRVLEGLAASGALDDFGFSRRALAVAIPDLVQAYSALRKKENEGQESLFNLFADEEEEETFPEIVVNDIPEFSKKEKLSRERYSIGLYVSDHPLSEMSRSIAARATASTADIKEASVPIASGFDNSIPKQTIAGLLSSLEVKTSKKGDRFAIITIEDMVGSIEAPVFPKMYEQIGHKLVQDNIYVFTGTPRYKNEGEEESEINFMIDHIEELETDDAGRMITWFRINEDQKVNGAGRALQEVLSRHKGDNMVYVAIRNRDGSVENVNFGENFKVEDSAELRRDVQVLFGTNCLGRW